MSPNPKRCRLQAAEQGGASRDKRQAVTVLCTCARPVLFDSRESSWGSVVCVNGLLPSRLRALPCLRRAPRDVVVCHGKRNHAPALYAHWRRADVPYRANSELDPIQNHPLSKENPLNIWGGISDSEVFDTILNIYENVPTLPWQQNIDNKLCRYFLFSIFIKIYFKKANPNNTYIIT